MGVEQRRNHDGIGGDRRDGYQQNGLVDRRVIQLQNMAIQPTEGQGYQRPTDELAGQRQPGKTQITGQT